MNDNLKWNETYKLGLDKWLILPGPTSVFVASMPDGSSSSLFTSGAAVGFTWDSLAVAASWLFDVSPLAISSVAVSLLPDVSLRIVYLHVRIRAPF